MWELQALDTVPRLDYKNPIVKFHALISLRSGLLLLWRWEMTDVDAAMLPPQWEKFATEYARIGNASEAARVAGYSVRCAGQQGWALLKNPQILARIQELQADWHSEQVAALKTHISPAIKALGGIVKDGGKHGDQAVVLAATALLDRAGFKPIDKSEVKASTVMQINISQDDAEL